jgi:hypothetical protein
MARGQLIDHSKETVRRYSLWARNDFNISTDKPFLAVMGAMGSFTLGYEGRR